MKPIYKNPFCKLQTMNDLDKKSFSQSYNELKFKVKILIIDDQKFSFLDEMRNVGFNIQSITDLDDINLATAYDIIISDVRGVGIKLKYDYEGVGLIKALKKHFPYKEYGVYTGNNIDLEMTEFLEHVEMISKSFGKDDWEELLTKLVKKVINPKEIWRKMRSYMFESNVPLYDILLLEHKYVNMVNNGQTDFTHFFDDTPNEISRELKDMLISVIVKILKPC